MFEIIVYASQASSLSRHVLGVELCCHPHSEGDPVRTGKGQVLVFGRKSQAERVAELFLQGRRLQYSVERAKSVALKVRWEDL